MKTTRDYTTKEYTKQSFNETKVMIYNEGNDTMKAIFLYCSSQLLGQLMCPLCGSTASPFFFSF